MVTSSMKWRIMKHAAPARSQHVLGRERVLHRVWIEASALIAHGHDKFGRVALGRGAEVDEHDLGRVALVAVCDGVDDGFADGHRRPVQ